MSANAYASKDRKRTGLGKGDAGRNIASRNGAGRSDAGSTGRSRARMWRDIWGLLLEFWAARPLASFTMVVLTLAGGARAGLYALAPGRVVDALTSPDAGTGGDGRLVFWLMVYFGGRALEEVYWALQPILSNYLLDHGAHRIQRRVLERAAAAPLIQFEAGSFFDHLQRAASGMGERLIQLFGRLSWLLQDLFRFGSVGVVLLFVHPALLPLLAVGTLPSIWLQARVATVMYEAQRLHTTRDRIRGHLQGLLTGREAAAEVRLFGAAGYLLNRWRRLRYERQQDIVAAERRRALFTTAGYLAAQVTYAVGLVLVASLILRGSLSLGDYVIVTSAALSFQEILGNTIQGLSGLEEQSQFLGDLFDFWRVAEVEGEAGRAEEAGRADGHPVGAGQVNGQRVEEKGASGHRSDVGEANGRRVDDGHDGGLSAGRGEKVAGTRKKSERVPRLARMAGSAASRRGMTVEAEGLTFTYPGGSRPVVRGVGLRIEPGERIAIVGENGAGKTTLVKLLGGLYQPDAGVVRLDGEVLTPERAVEARRRIAAVFQDYATFQLMARENIGFGHLERMHDDRALAVAAGRAGIAELIEGMPQRYDTYLGRQFGDTELSGGQWQRVALARAFFRDANLLVLDEPTAALDPMAELALFERFLELVEGRTAIMISHRLGAARLADRVIVLRDGVVVEEGHHDELVGKGGEYAALFAAQAQWYR